MLTYKSRCALKKNFIVVFLFFEKIVFVQLFKPTMSNIHKPQSVAANINIGNAIDSNTTLSIKYPIIIYNIYSVIHISSDNNKIVKLLSAVKNNVNKLIYKITNSISICEPDII